MFGSRNTTGAISMPAIEPIAAAMPQPSAIIQEVLMPTSRAHRKPHPREAEEDVQRDQQQQGDADHAGLMGRYQLATQKRRGAERRRVLLDGEIPDQAGDA